MIKINSIGTFTIHNINYKKSPKTQTVDNTAFTAARTGGPNVLAMFYKDLVKYNPISMEEERILHNQIREGGEIEKRARKKLVEVNLRFATASAKRYQNRGLELPDLIQEAQDGLIRASEDYNPDDKRGAKFISYASWWIKAYIGRAINDKARLVRIPANQETVLGKINKELKINDDIEQVANKLGISKSEAEDLRAAGSSTVSLDEPIKGSFDGSSKTYNDIIPDISSDIEEDVNARERQKLLSTLLEVLPKREQSVLKLYYGVDGSEPLTYREIGQRLNLSHERVRQIKTQALNKLTEYSKKNYKSGI